MRKACRPHSIFFLLVLLPLLRLPAAEGALSNTWQMTAAGCPVGRYYHTAVWTGTRMIVWGGYGSSELNTGGRYDPATDTWQPTSTTGAPAARAQHTAVWAGSQMIVWGGWDGSNFFRSGGRYDPVTDTW